MAFVSAAPSTVASPRERRTTGCEDPPSPGVMGDLDDDDGDGNACLSSTFTRGQRLFQERPMGNKAAKATSRAKAHLIQEAAANTAALDSLAASAAQRTALAFWSTQEASNSSEGRKWWANEERSRLQEAKEKDKDAQKGRDINESDLLVALPSSPRGQGQGTRGRRRRAHDEVEYNSDEVEGEAERAAARAGARGFGGARGARGGRGHGRGRGFGLGGRCDMCVLLLLLNHLHPHRRRLLRQPGCEAAPPTRYLRLKTTRTWTRRSPKAATDAQHVSGALRPWLLR